jgi:hypothetical protein
MLVVNPLIMLTNNLGAKLAPFPGSMLAVSQYKVLCGVGGSGGRRGWFWRLQKACGRAKCETNGEEKTAQKERDIERQLGMEWGVVCLV